MKENCFIFLSDENKYGSMYSVLLAEALERENVYFLNRTFRANGKIFGKLKKFFFSTLVNMKLKEIPCHIAHKILKNQYQLKELLQQKCEEYEIVYVIFFNASIKRYYSKEVLERMKNMNKKIKFHMFFMDPSTIFASENAMKVIDSKLFDNVFTVDKEDAKNNGWKYWPTPYSKITENMKAEYDIYFCGATKSRHNQLIGLIHYFDKNLVKYKMDVFYIRKKEKNLDKLLQVMDVEGIEHMKTYEQTINEMIHASCILEIVTEGQSATFTLRCYEAVIYNKKLLTNNKKIFEFPYYDSRYMKYFENVEDIDIGWLKKDIGVNYKYQGDYSPLKLLEEIRNGYYKEK